MTNADSRSPMGHPTAAAAQGVGTAASLSGTSVMLEHRTSETPGCQTLDGTTAMIMMASALGAMLTGWIGALKHASTYRGAFVAHLMLTGVGMAGTIAAAGVLSSLTVR